MSPARLPTDWLSVFLDGLLAQPFVLRVEVTSVFVDGLLVQPSALRVEVTELADSDAGVALSTLTLNWDNCKIGGTSVTCTRVLSLGGWGRGKSIVLDSFLYSPRLMLLYTVLICFWICHKLSNALQLQCVFALWSNLQIHLHWSSRWLPTWWFLATNCSTTRGKLFSMCLMYCSIKWSSSTLSLG